MPRLLVFTMPHDDDKNFGAQNRSQGDAAQDPEANSLGDDATFMGGNSDTSPRSLGDDVTFDGGGAADDELYDDGMEIVDLEARYKIESVLGKGGMGEVLLATDQRLKRKVAIKRMLGNAAGSQTAVSRFLTEAQSMADINHPNIVSIHDHGRAKDGPFLIMEYVEGGSLLDLCRAGALPADQAIHLVCKLCDGLVKAHAANIIHRDIKPANVLLTEDGEPKLTDFGLAKDGAADTGMTMTGTVLGTLDFMPPEQRRDATQTDARSDLWSLAATLYQMITGRSPKVIRLDLVHESLRPVLAQALEEDPGDRFQTAAEMRDALSASLAGQTADSGDVELEAGACPHCGTKNPTNRKFCRNPDCGCSLEVPCLSCDSKIPMWEQVCNDCGSPQRDLLEQRRQQMASGRSAAESCLEKCDFERAQKLAIALRDEPDLRLQHLKGWAARFLPEIGARRERELKRIGALMSEALTHQQAHDYATGLRTLEQVPALLANVAVPPQQQTANDLKTALEQSLAEINRLDDLIHSRVTKRELDGLLAEVEALQTLQPDREDLEQLHAQLAKREAKLRATRDEAFSAPRKQLDCQHDGDGLKLGERSLPHLVERPFTNSIGMLLTPVPCGEFLMGSPSNEMKRRRNERQRLVEISEPFYLAAFHSVTRLRHHVTSLASEFTSELETLEPYTTKKHRAGKKSNGDGDRLLRPIKSRRHNSNRS